MLRKKSTYFCCILILDIINKLLTRSPLGGGVSETSNGMAETQFLDQKTASGKSAWNFACDTSNLIYLSNLLISQLH